MALVTTTTLTTDIAPHVDGCPSAVVAQYMTKTMIDLCERAKVWRVQLADVPLVALTYNYPLASPVAGTEVSSLLFAHMAGLTEPAKEIGLLTEEQVHAYHSDWPNLAAPTRPEGIFRLALDSFNVVPVPDALDTYTVSLWAAIRPTVTATQIESTVYSEYRRAIFHGTLHELMVMPKRAWSDPKLAEFHGKQWEYFVNSARAKANKGFGRTSIRVVPRPWA